MKGMNDAIIMCLIVLGLLWVGYWIGKTEVTLRFLYTGAL